MSENILDPGWISTACSRGRQDVLPARTYRIERRMIVINALPYHRPFAAANNLFANIEDMAKLAQAGLNRGILDDQCILRRALSSRCGSLICRLPLQTIPLDRSILQDDDRLGHGGSWQVAGHVPIPAGTSLVSAPKWR